MSGISAVIMIQRDVETGKIWTYGAPKASTR